MLWIVPNFQKSFAKIFKRTFQEKNVWNMFGKNNPFILEAILQLKFGILTDYFMLATCKGTTCRIATLKVRKWSLSPLATSDFNSGVVKRVFVRW